MSCENVRTLCKRLVISDSVTFADDTLLIDIPAGTYMDNEKYCIVVAQSIPDETTINAPVAITIGGDTTTTYPLMNCDCSTVYACSINTRTRYSVCVKTGIADGVFRLLGKIPCSRCADNALSLPITPAATTPVTPPTTG